MSLQITKEDEFIWLQQGKIIMLEYASKFMELSQFTLVFVAYEKMKMNYCEVELNPNFRGTMSVW